jgi:hypothetical protein
LAGFIALLYLSLVAPNALHPNWYGGGSFAGRFGLAGGIVLIVPAAYGLSRLFAKAPWLGVLACFGHLSLQGFLWSQVVFGGLSIFNRPGVRWLEDYPSPWSPHQYWLPAFFRVDLALRHWPNLGWTIALVALLAAGWTWRRHENSTRAPAAWATFAAAGLAMVVASIAGGRLERPIWQLFSPDSIRAAQLDGEPVRVVYGNPADWRAAEDLMMELSRSGVSACVERPRPSAQISPSARCDLISSIGASPRVAIMHGVEWSLQRLPQQEAAAKLELDFAKNGQAHLGRGWSAPESWGIWSDSAQSELHFDRTSLAGNLQLDADCQAFVPSPEAVVRVGVAVNGEKLATWTFDASDNRSMRSLWIPARLITGHPDLTVTFAPMDRISPRAAGVSPDPRPLGIGLFRVILRAS